MRPIHIVKLDTSRPAVILTRATVQPYIGWSTVAPITNTIKGLTTEVPIGVANGVAHDCVISCDNITTVPVEAVGRQIGYLWKEQEPGLARAIINAFDLE